MFYVTSVITYSALQFYIIDDNVLRTITSIFHVQYCYGVKVLKDTSLLLLGAYLYVYLKPLKLRFYDPIL